MNLILYGLSFIVLWHQFKLHLGWFFAIGYAYAAIFSFIVIATVLNQITFGSMDYTLIAVLVFFTSCVVSYKIRPPVNSYILSPYAVLTAFLLCLAVVYAFGFNSARLFEYNDKSISVVGTNDDNANHMALALISIKSKSMLSSSYLLKKMTNDSLAKPAAKWYPFGLYTNMHIGYILFKDALGIKDQFEIKTFFSFDTVYTVCLLLVALILLYALVDRLYKIRSIYTFALSLTVGFMVVVGEFLLKLQVFGFHSQLAGYCIFLAYLITLDIMNDENDASIVTMFITSIFMIVVGFTYYLFIPLVGVGYFIFHSEKKFKKRKRLLPYIALIISCIPLILFNFKLPINEQATAYGVAFVQFTGIMTATLGVLLGTLAKRINQFLRKILILLFGLNIIMMIVGTISMYTNTGNFGYYFFKSYWTLGILGLPLLIVALGYVGDTFLTKNIVVKVVITTISTCIAGGIFYFVFAQRSFDSRGYDMLLMVRNGNYNYPFDQKKWIKTYEKYKNTNGKNIYSIGIWGQTVLSYSLFEDAPDFMKLKFRSNQYSFEDPASLVELTVHIADRLQSHKKTVLLDNLKGIDMVKNSSQNTSLQQLFKTSPYLE